MQITIQLKIWPENCFSNLPSIRITTSMRLQPNNSNKLRARKKVQATTYPFIFISSVTWQFTFPDILINHKSNIYFD